MPAKLVIPGKDKYEIIYSEEGCTQGCVGAMVKYGIATKPLIDNLMDIVDPNRCKHAQLLVFLLQKGDKSELFGESFLYILTLIWSSGK